MAEISFDGRFFALALDDGRRVLLLDVKDNIANASCRSLLQQQFEGFGQATGQEAPLVPIIVQKMREAAGASVVGDFAAIVMLLKNLLATPRAARLLVIGASLGSPCLHLATTLLPEAVSHPIPGAPPLASLSITAVAPLADDADVAKLPSDVLPIRTNLARMMLPRDFFDLLLFDARDLAAMLSGQELVAALRQAAAALVPQGLAVLLGPPQLDVSSLERVQSFPFASETSIFFGRGCELTDVSDGGAKMREERMRIGQLLRQYLAGEADVLAAIEGVRHYGGLLSAQPADVPWRGERARAAQALEILIDRRLGQSSAGAEETLRGIADVFAISKE